MRDLDRRAMLLGVGAAAVAACARPSPADGRSSEVRTNLYNCDGCQAVSERSPAGMPSRLRLADPSEPGERLILSGQVIKADGTGPAPGVVIYAHQTNATGLYANGSPETEWSRRHGRLRGWVKTGSDGRYTFDTIKPAPYPNDTMPAHIHLFIAEPGRRPYYIDDVIFDGEFGVTPAYRAQQEFRGGSGIIRLARSRSGVWLARRDIRLERHR